VSPFCRFSPHIDLGGNIERALANGELAFGQPDRACGGAPRQQSDQQSAKEFARSLPNAATYCTTDRII